MNRRAGGPLLEHHPATAAAADDRRPPSRAWRVVPVALVIFGIWLSAIELAEAARPAEQVRTAALFGHLAALVSGFGAVLVIDWMGLLWALGRRTFLDVTRTADALHVVIWASLFVLVASGVLLHPDAAAVLTRIKLALVLVIAVNGLYAHALAPQLTAVGPGPPPRALLAKAAVTAIVSQACWWAAMAIGFLNSQG